MSDEKTPRVFAAVIEVQRNIEGVTKDRNNKDQGFKFRGVDDVYNMLHEQLAKAGLVTIPRVLDRVDGERSTRNGGSMLHVKLKVEYDFVAEDGSRLTVGPVWGEALDNSDKASNKALAFAHKYAMLQTFTVPTEDTRETTEERDADNRTTETTGAAPAQQKPAAAQGTAQAGPPPHVVMMQKFAEIGLARQHLEHRWAKRVEDFAQAQLDDAREIYRLICEQPHRRSEFFSPPFNTTGAPAGPPPQGNPPPRGGGSAARLNQRIAGGRP